MNYPTVNESIHDFEAQTSNQQQPQNQLVSTTIYQMPDQPLTGQLFDGLMLPHPKEWHCWNNFEDQIQSQALHELTPVNIYFYSETNDYDQKCFNDIHPTLLSQSETNRFSVKFEVSSPSENLFEVSVNFYRKQYWHLFLF